MVPFWFLGDFTGEIFRDYEWSGEEHCWDISPAAPMLLKMGHWDKCSYRLPLWESVSIAAPLKQLHHRNDAVKCGYLKKWACHWLIQKPQCHWITTQRRTKLTIHFVSENNLAIKCLVYLSSSQTKALPGLVLINICFILQQFHKEKWMFEKLPNKITLPFIRMNSLLSYMSSSFLDIC